MPNLIAALPKKLPKLVKKSKTGSKESKKIVQNCQWAMHLVKKANYRVRLKVNWEQPAKGIKGLKRDLTNSSLAERISFPH